MKRPVGEAKYRDKSGSKTPVLKTSGGQRAGARAFFLLGGEGMPKTGGLQVSPRGPLRIYIATLLILLGAMPARALHRESNPVTQITSNGTNVLSLGRSWDRNIAFSSTQDLLQNGSTGRQIFVFQLADFDCQSGFTRDTTVCPPQPWFPYLQVTTGPGSPDNPSVAIHSIQVPNPNGSNDPNGAFLSFVKANWVAFDADGSWGGALAPPGCTGACAQHRQIFMVNVAGTNEVRRITSGVDGDSVRPTLSLDGGIIAFESTASLPGAQGPPNVHQVWLAERDTGILKQVTKGLAPSFAPALTREGSFVVFESSAQLTAADGHDTGVLQIWVSQYNKGTAVLSGPQPITNGNGHSQHPYLELHTVYFDSEATNLPGGDTRAAQRIFSAPVDQGALPNVTQLPNPAQTPNVNPDDLGDCSFPSMDGVSFTHVSFICTGDPLHNGTVGNRLFTYQIPTAQTPNGILAQMTGAGDIQGPISANVGNFFVSFSSTEDLSGAGACGRQIFLIDFFTTFPDNTSPVVKWVGATIQGQLPPDLVPTARRQSSVIGKHEFIWLPGSGASGSQESVVTLAGTSSTPIAGSGVFSLQIGAPDIHTGIAGITVPALRSSFPPILIPGSSSALCLTPSADGAGKIDCLGGSQGGDLTITQDHNTDVSDPQCILGCREGTACQNGFPGPHLYPCPICSKTGLGTAGTCVGGYLNGSPCTQDSQCQPFTRPKCLNGTCTNAANQGQSCVTDAQCSAVSECVNASLGVCNGPVQATLTGTFAAGGMQLQLPVTFSLSTGQGIDGKYCTKDDTYAVENVPTTLWFDTGTVSATIADADNILGGGSTIAASAKGTPFDCTQLREGGMANASLVGIWPRLDMPDTPALHDILLELALKPTPAVTNSCGCTTNADCNSVNPCAGVATCVNGQCVPGTPFNCSDGNPCNGLETCDPVLAGCLQGTAPPNGTQCGGDLCSPSVCQSEACVASTPLSCDDSNPCTQDTCDPSRGCIHANLPNGTTCGPLNACFPQMCSNGTCLTHQVSCDDHNPCTTDLPCDPMLGCRHVAVADGTSCDDGNPCNGAEICRGGACTPGTPQPDNTPCGPADICNGSLVCKLAQCVATAPLNCNDGNACTSDACDPVLGCVHSTVQCSAGPRCSVGTCDPVQGCVYQAMSDLPGASCLLGALRDMLTNAPPGGFKNRKFQFGATSLVGKAVSRLVVAANALPGRPKTNAIREADKTIVHFSNLIGKGAHNGKIAGPFAADLGAMAGRVHTALRPLLPPFGAQAHTKRGKRR